MKTILLFLVFLAFFGLSPSKCEKRLRRQIWQRPPNPDPFWMGHSPEFHRNDDYFNSPEDAWVGPSGFNRPLENNFQSSQFNGGNTQNQWDDFQSNGGNDQNSRGNNRRNGNNKNKNKQRNQNRKNGNNRRNQSQNNESQNSDWNNESQNNRWEQSQDNQNSQNNRWDQTQNNQNNRRDQNQNNNRRDQNNNNNNNNNRRDQNQGTTEPTGPLSTTPTTIHVAPEGCPCPMTQQFNPVCGTDGNTYRNEGLLNCYQRCGKGVSQKRLGVC